MSDPQTLSMSFTATLSDGTKCHPTIHIVGFKEMSQPLKKEGILQLARLFKALSESLWDQLLEEEDAQMSAKERDAD